MTLAILFLFCSKIKVNYVLNLEFGSALAVPKKVFCPRHDTAYSNPSSLLIWYVMMTYKNNSFMYTDEYGTGH